MITRSLFLASAASLLAVANEPAIDLFRAEALAQGQQQSEVVLSLFNPGVHDKLGLPDFVVAGADAELSAAAKTVADVLWDDLDFEREYYMIPRKTSASVPVMPAEALPYDRWAELGADAVLVANASRSGAALTIELRIMEVKQATRGRQAFGARYTCQIQQPRYCAHSIADEVHKLTKALDGVARTKLAFSSDRDATRVAGRPSQTTGIGKEIYISDYDGAGQQRITVNRSVNISPAWSPGGTMIAYTSYSVGGFPDIFIANLREPGRLLRPAGGTDRIHNQMASWSPDGTKLAFVSWRSGNADVWVVNRDGTGLLNLTNHRADDGAPTWSPDGGRIAFTSDRETGGTPLLYVMNASGAGVQSLTRVRADRPTWSRHNFIAFTSGGGPGHDIAILDMSEAGAGVRILTDSNGTNEGPAVSPNGRHIAFFTTRWGRQQIAVIDRAGQNIRQITNSGNNTYPNWQPFAAGQK
jgi:TolB protein